MRKRALAVCVMGLLVFVSTATVWARGPRDGSGGPKTGFLGGRADCGLKDLTDEQKDKIKTLKRAERKALRSLFNKEQELLDTLGEQVEDKADNAALERTMSAIKFTQDAIREQVDKFRAQVESILTPEQRAQRLLNSPHRGWGRGAGRREDCPMRSDGEGPAGQEPAPEKEAR
ncbi:MAG TPA: periplasmic heavy metal sensor [Elusimicrobiota bacterium]|nr:periplasmic heavy metal sensor [Elusimicrobiota bacterium]